MATKIVKYLSIVALLIAVLWRGSLDYRLILAFVVCWGAIIVVRQAFRSHCYGWAFGFFLIAILFNPIWIFRFPAGVTLWVDVVCLTAFAASLILLKSQPVLSIPSITDRTPESESL
ncbi:MAG TPA: DUF6804 family protein [Terriglobales bacterium]|nr:DUF6804 family protein [Terriglobales bacterium]